MFRFKLILVLFIAVSLIGCDSDKNIQENKVSDVEKKCQYKVSLDSSLMVWTGFKFNDRVGVKGEFDSIYISGNTFSGSPMESLKGLQFEIPTSSVNTNDAGRNKKIHEIFFGTFNTSNIIGSIDSINGMTAILQLNMNKVSISKKINFQLSSDRILESKFNINVEDWNGLEAIAALNKACEEKHTGNDSESVLWPDVDILLRTRLEKNCE